MVRTKREVETILTQAGIVTVKDVDTYAWAHPYTDQQGRACIPSRYKVLKKLLGENVAMHMLHELSIRQCT